MFKPHFPSVTANLRWVTLTAVLGASALCAQGSHVPGPGLDLSGVYQAISQDAILPRGLKNSGSPQEIALSPAAVAQKGTVNLKDDPGRVCLPVGPFRMMAMVNTKIELVPGPGILVMLFEDISHGHMRTIYLERNHPEKVELTWEGDSVGRWEKDTLVVDTVGFNDRTWLNGMGAQHSEALHLTERIRPILAGKYLEYKVTAEDPKSLAAPYTYTRYYEKVKTEIMEDVCEAEE